MRWAGIDLGTTHLKAVLYDDRARRIVSSATAPTPMRTADSLSAHDAEEVTRIALDLLGTALDGAAEPASLGGIAVASVAEEIVVVDAKDNPTGETLAWYDPRGRDEAEAFYGESRTGLHERFRPDPWFSLFKLLWLRAHRPAELERCVRVLDLSAFMLVRLGGAAVMDWSHASRTGVFDPESASWDAQTIAAAGLPAAWLPPLVPSGTIAGQVSNATAARLRIGRGTPLVTGGHDHFCGAFASGVRAAGEMHLSAGTSEAQLVITDGPVDGVAGGYAFDQGRFVDGHHWYVHIGIPTGHAYRQWTGLLFGAEDEAVIDAEVAHASAAEIGVMFDPGMSGGSEMLAGLTPSADRATILRAVVEGSAVASSRVTRVLEATARAHGKRIVVAGHAGRNPLWRELRSGLTGRSLELVDEPETAALGAALMAQRAVTGAADVDAVTRTIWRPTPAIRARSVALLERYDRFTWGAATAQVGERG
jgi:sugar (pentulose or hexulose) kinase